MPGATHTTPITVAPENLSGDISAPSDAAVDISFEAVPIARQATTETDPGAPATDTSLPANPLSEADVYLAYGYYDQAAALLSRLVTQFPDVVDYRLRLLRVLQACEEKTAFFEHATLLKQQLGEDDPSIWDEVAGMGRHLFPKAILFALDDDAESMNPEFEKTIFTGTRSDLDSPPLTESPTSSANIDLLLDTDEVDTGVAGDFHDPSLTEPTAHPLEMSMFLLEAGSDQLSDDPLAGQSSTPNQATGLDLDLDSLNVSASPADQSEAESLDLDFSEVLFDSPSPGTAPAPEQEPEVDLLGDTRTEITLLSPLDDAPDDVILDIDFGEEMSLEEESQTFSETVTGADSVLEADQELTLPDTDLETELANWEGDLQQSTDTPSELATEMFDSPETFELEDLELNLDLDFEMDSPDDGDIDSPDDEGKNKS